MVSLSIAERVHYGTPRLYIVGPDTDKFNAAASAIQDLTGKATVTPADLSRLQTLGLRFNCSHCMRTIDDPIAAASRNSGSVCVHSSAQPFNS
jgi:hypothetical protein